MKELLQPEIKEVRRRYRLPRALMALGLVTMLTGADLINRFVSAEEAQSNTICSVGVKIRGIEFVDLGGERGIYDPGIDREVGTAGNFTVIALALDRVSELGRTNVGADGTGFIRGIDETCNTTGPNGRPALDFIVKTEESNLGLRVNAEDGFAAKVTVGVEVKDGRADIPRDRRDVDRDRDVDTDSNTSSQANSNSNSNSESSVNVQFPESKPEVKLPDRMKVEIEDQPVAVTGAVNIGDLELKRPLTVTIASSDTDTEIAGGVIGVRPVPPDLGNWRWWPWLIIPAVIAGGLAGLGAFLGGVAGRRAVAVHEDEHHETGPAGHAPHAAEGHTRTTRTTRRETRRTEGVAEGTPEGTARATRETRETRETKETT